MDVGCQARISDSGVSSNSSLCKALSNATLNLPRLRSLPMLNKNHLSSDNETKEITFVFVVDDAFTLTVNIKTIKPYETICTKKFR